MAMASGVRRTEGPQAKGIVTDWPKPMRGSVSAANKARPEGVAGIIINCYVLSVMTY